MKKNDDKILTEVRAMQRGILKRGDKVIIKWIEEEKDKEKQRFLLAINDLAIGTLNHYIKNLKIEDLHSEVAN